LGTLYRLHGSTQKKSFLGFHFPEAHATQYHDESLNTHAAEEYVAHATATAVITHHVHTNPITESVIGFDAVHTVLETEESQQFVTLENQAHEKKVLLSSDAMRYFISKITTYSEQTTILDEVLTKTRVSFPSEDGWVALNLQRMEVMLDEVQTVDSLQELLNLDLEHSVSYTPMTAGSLGEAVLLKDMSVALTLIADRPMIALADAVSDITALRAYLHGEDVFISDMLKAEGNKLSMETIEEVLRALSSALDGTSHDETEAVKMALSRAIAVLQ